jgi:hypothetical protein
MRQRVLDVAGGYQHRPLRVLAVPLEGIRPQVQDFDARRRSVPALEVGVHQPVHLRRDGRQHDSNQRA